MTVSYSLECANCRLATFGKLLFRWKGSIYKLLYKELFIFLFLYTLLSCSYRFLLSESQKRDFEDVARYCNIFVNTYIPLVFVLGFYISLVVTRWWDQFCYIPWPDRLAMHIATNVIGSDERGRLLRRTLIRYINLAFVLCLRDISLAVHKRFPSTEHLVEAGFMTEHELKEYDQAQSSHAKFWLPIQWAQTLMLKIRYENRLAESLMVASIIQLWTSFMEDPQLTCFGKDINDFRDKLTRLMSYDWISVPLSYTQVATIAVYSYFLACLVGRQFLENTVDRNEKEPDMYFPIFTTCQFLFYVGWLKVGESLLNPFGEDDDDFEVNYLIDRNLQVSYMIVDDNYDRLPPIERDAFWFSGIPQIPHTIASVGLMDRGFSGSVQGVNVRPAKQELFVPMMSTMSASRDCIFEDDAEADPYMLRHPRRSYSGYSKLTSSPSSAFPFRRPASSGVSPLIQRGVSVQSGRMNLKSPFRRTHSEADHGGIVPSPQQAKVLNPRITALKGTAASTSRSHLTRFGSCKEESFDDADRKDVV